MGTYNKEDLIREFNIAKESCDSYFDYLYKVLQFSIAAIIAIIVAAAQLFGNDASGIENIDDIRAIILSYILPICTYIFGVMYAYNAYALTVCGKHAEQLHNKIYEFKSVGENKAISNCPDIKKYIVTNRSVTIFPYGLQLAFYMGFPVASNVFSIILCKDTSNFFFYRILPFIFTGIYLAIIFLIIIKIAKDFFIKSDDCTE